jgi:hypothetical protein
MGADATTVRNSRDLPEAVAAIQQRSRPVLIELKLNPDDIQSYIP